MVNYIIAAILVATTCTALPRKPMNFRKSFHKQTSLKARGTVGGNSGYDVEAPDPIYLKTDPLVLEFPVPPYIPEPPLYAPPNLPSVPVPVIPIIETEIRVPSKHPRAPDVPDPYNTDHNGGSSFFGTDDVEGVYDENDDIDAETYDDNDQGDSGASADSPAFNTCTSSIHPDAAEGFCVTRGQMRKLCYELTIAKSDDCGRSEWCCYDKDDVLQDDDDNNNGGDNGNNGGDNGNNGADNGNSEADNGNNGGDNGNNGADNGNNGDDNGDETGDDNINIDDLIDGDNDGDDINGRVGIAIGMPQQRTSLDANKLILKAIRPTDPVPIATISEETAPIAPRRRNSLVAF